MNAGDTVLLTGATGYVGGRLLGALRGRGLRLRCLVRDPERLAPARDRDDGRGAGAEPVQAVRGDLLEPATLAPALAGVDVAYYLVHSMGAGPSFEALDRRAAQNFAAAARVAGVRRIVYLGGLGSGDDLSAHLRSRQEVGRILRASGAAVLELRASIVLGSGSLSFEMIRALVERLPVMVTPRWVDVEAQPIAIEDLLAYLVAALDVPLAASRVVEVGGADRASYGELMREYARQRGLARRMLRVPVLTPRLSGLWLGLVTPVFARVGRALVESIRHPTVVEDDAPARELFDVEPAGIRRAIADALELEQRLPLDGGVPPVPFPARPPRVGVRAGNRWIDSRSIDVRVPAEEAFAPVRRIGGRTGWYAHDALWRLRGWMDRCVGGPGLAPGRRDPEELRRGDVLDCWRVEELEEGRRLLLRATMRLPGRAWLEFEVRPLPAPAGAPGGARIRQTAVYDPRGLWGLAYWFLVCPLHALVFAGMLRAIAARAERGRRPDWSAARGACDA